jgi:hypothetical protein
MADEAEPGLHARSLPIEHGVGIGGAGVGGVRALLGPEVDGRVAAAITAITAIAAVRPVGLVLWAEALHAGPRLDQRTVDADVVARKEPPHPRLRQDRRQEASGDVAIKLNISGMDANREEPAIGISQDVALAPGDLLARIIALFAPF